jgi:hypothetical protein
MNETEARALVEKFNNHKGKISDPDWAKYNEAFHYVYTNVDDEAYVSDVVNLVDEWSKANPDAVREYKGKQRTKSFIGDILDTGLSVADLMTSRAQIRQAKAAQANSKEPAAPGKYKLDENVSRSIRDTLQAMSPAGIEQQLSPLKQDIVDSYSSDMNNAEVASGGQAGSFGSYGQSAVNRRLRAAGNLQLTRTELNDNLRKNLNYALQNRLNERQIEQSRDMNVYKTKMDQYNAEQAAAGALEQAGRINQRDSIYRLNENLTPFINRAVDNQSANKASAATRATNKMFTNGGINDSAILQKPGSQEIIDWGGKVDYNNSSNNYDPSMMSTYDNRLSGDLLRYKLNIG